MHALTPLTVDLTMLLCTVALVILLVLPYVLGRFGHWTISDIVGNRHDPPPVAPWVDRAQRAHRNMLENLTPFAALVMMAHATGHNNAVTATGAVLFFSARLAHALLYLFGIVWFRTLAWIGGLIGMAIIFSQLI